MMPTLIITLGLTLSSPALAATVYTHCKVNEMVVYSCATGSRILSICASPFQRTRVTYNIAMD